MKRESMFASPTSPARGADEESDFAISKDVDNLQLMDNQDGLPDGVPNNVNGEGNKGA